MALTAAEQYLMELINRARLDPVGEARRHGVDLNAGLAAGSITAASKQVLAPNALLETAATKHALWMIDTDTISHTGVDGSTPYQRAVAAGYKPGLVGENIAWRGTTGTMNLASYIDTQHKDLFLSAGHRANMLSDKFREIGVAQEGGTLRYNGVDYRSSMITEVFGSSGTAKFVTGVAYTDADKNGFYSMGEGVGGVSFASAGTSTLTASAGGYALTVDAVNATKALDVTGVAGRMAFSVKLDMTAGNVKLDIVNGTQALTSGSITLVSGLNNVTLLGLNALNATGNDVGNTVTGNSGANIIYGYGGNDVLSGAAGNDSLFSGIGDDFAYGGDGNDLLHGGLGRDVLTGGNGADAFIFTDGAAYDAIADFTVGSDRLRIDDANWKGAMTAAAVVSTFARVVVGGVLFDFGGGDQLMLSGLTTTTGLAAAIDII